MTGATKDKDKNMFTTKIGAARPIIDITGDLIRRVFAGRVTVNVEYTDRIVIS